MSVFLVYDPHREFAIHTLIVGKGEWVCPDCGKSYDFPPYAPEDLDPEKH